MHAGTILWNGLDLSTIGKPKLTINRVPDPPAPAFPTREITTLKVTVDLHALDPGTIQARARHLMDSMKVTEGILRSATGSGHGIEWLAVPAGDNLSAVLSGGSNSIELGFSAVENHSEAATGSITAATFTPAGGAAITLHAARDITETISPERHSPLASARRRTNVTIQLTARVAQSNPADPLAARLAYLQARAAEVKALDCREGTLVFGSVNRIVRVTELSPVIDERRGVLDVRIQCFYTVLPDDTKAELSFNMRERTDEGNGEKAITLSGKIEAETRAIALAKLDALRTATLTTGRRMTGYETQDEIIDGADTAGVTGADWTGALNFTLEIREAREGAHYTLKIQTERDIRNGMRWNYTGSVTGTSVESALQTARGLVADTGHPVKTRSEENVEYVSDILVPPGSAQGQPHFVKVDFSYQFEGPSDGFIGGEIRTDRNTPLFGEWRRTLSGFLIATDRQTAETRLAALLASEGTGIDVTRQWTETYLDETGNNAATAKRVFQRLEFSSSFRSTRTNASARYTDTTSTDAATMLSERSVSGSVWSDTAGNADTALDTLLTIIFGNTAPQRKSTTHQRERWGSGASATTSLATNSGWVQLDFQASNTTKMIGEPGYDIIEASLTCERVGSINNTVITPAPFNRPVAQVGTGYLPGSVTISATCKAVSATTARAWVQGKRAIVSTIGTDGFTRHETQQPRESSATGYAPFSGASITTHTFTGSYGWTFTGSVLDNIWPSTFNGY